MSRTLILSRKPIHHLAQVGVQALLRAPLLRAVCGSGQGRRGGMGRHGRHLQRKLGERWRRRRCRRPIHTSQPKCHPRLLCPRPLGLALLAKGRGELATAHLPPQACALARRPASQRRWVSHGVQRAVRGVPAWRRAPRAAVAAAAWGRSCTAASCMATAAAIGARASRDEQEEAGMTGLEATERHGAGSHSAAAAAAAAAEVPAQGAPISAIACAAVRCRNRPDPATPQQPVRFERARLGLHACCSSCVSGDSGMQLCSWDGPWARLDTAGPSHRSLRCGLLARPCQIAGRDRLSPA